MTRIENVIKFGRVVFESRERTNRQTDRHADTLIATVRTPTGGGEGGRSNNISSPVFHQQLLVRLAM